MSLQQGINIYARNFRYTADENKPLLSKLSSALKENQWLKVSSQKFDPKEIRNVYNELTDKEAFYLKPTGSWFSKGSWLFHEDMCCRFDDELIIVEVDYSNIYRIFGEDKQFKTLFNDFTSKYGRVIDEGGDMCEFSGYITDKDYSAKYDTCRSKKNKIECKQTQDCRWYEMPSFNSYNWKKVSRDYRGFAIYPIPSKKFIDSAGLDRTALLGYDVESLVLWDVKPIIRYCNLGKIRDIIGITGKTQGRRAGTKHYQDYLPVMTKNLVTRIKELNQS